jgi:hypothetical protein
MLPLALVDGVPDRLSDGHRGDERRPLTHVMA